MARLKHTVFLSADTLTDRKFISAPGYENLWLLLPNLVIFQSNLGPLGYPDTPRYFKDFIARNI